jgi:hypothetical protein
MTWPEAAMVDMSSSGFAWKNVTDAGFEQG